MTSKKLVDPFGRTISYLRLSVTDRCDFRCTYCMAEDMTFVPRNQLLSLEELAFIAQTFIELGTKRIRITGGEPLIRRNITSLMSEISAQHGLEDLSITTNGSHLSKYAEDLLKVGVTRINVSLDSLDAGRFKVLTRTGDLTQVLEGIESARRLPFKKIKLNVVALRGFNEHEIPDLVAFAVDKHVDISFIEEMPLGETTAHNRKDAFLPSQEIRERLAKHYRLQPSNLDTGGPSRYWRIPETQTQIGFISPHSDNFCNTCNRVRLTSEGKLLMCLGNEHSVDLRAVIRQHPFEKTPLIEAIKHGLTIKPERHHFNLDEPPQIIRFMNATGG